MKQRLIATVAISVLWIILDYLFHGVILAGAYTATSAIWRPMAEMKPLLMNATTVLTALVFVLTFCQMVPAKDRQKGIKIGLLVGLIVGIGNGLGSYCYLPITTQIASVWFIAAVVKFTVAGAAVGTIVTKNID
ncbi:hypothetical protein HOH87_00465 [bacterium]|jgi:hypothetical protein|nr:hypothetical protein [bacterium]